MGDSPDKTSEKLQLSLGRKLLKGCVVLSRWMLIILLALILAGGLYFKAPWKVLVLDGVLLALLTIVPKKKRKYGWLALGIIVLAVTVWIFIPESDSSNWRVCSFDEEIQAYNSKYAVPDEDNTAVIFEKISAKYEDTFYRWPDLSEVKKLNDPNSKITYIRQQIQLQGADFYPDRWTDELDDLTLYYPWKSKDYPELAQWLNQNRDEIQLLIEASNKPYCQFQYTFDSLPFSFKSAPSFAVTEWFDLLRRAANNDWADGRIDQTIEKYCVMFKLNKLFLQTHEWSLATMSIRQYRYLNKVLSRFILENPLTDVQLDTLETAMEYQKYDLKELFDQWLEYDQLKIKQTYAILYEVNENGKTRFNRTSHNETMRKMGIMPPTKSRSEEKIKKLSSVASWFWIPETPQKLAALVDDVYNPVYQTPANSFQEEITIGSGGSNFRFTAIESLLDAQLQIFHGIYKSQSYENLHANAYQIMIALRRYKNQNGSWPETLDVLVAFTNNDIYRDPLNESQLIYKKTGEDFILYSKGKNGIDEGGSHESEADDILLWPVELDNITE